MISDNPAFGIIIIFLAYEIGLAIHRRVKHPFSSALVIANIIIISFLLITKIPYEDFSQGGKIIQFMLGPATVALIIPLYRRWDVLKQNWIAVLGGVLAGSVVSLISVIVFGKIFCLDYTIILSMLAKSVTAPIGIELSGEYGGLVVMTVISILCTGLIGAVTGPVVLEKLHITNPVAVGVALGATYHVVGATRAMDIGETEGAMAGLCIGLAGIMTVILMPFAVLLL